MVTHIWETSSGTSETISADNPCMRKRIWRIAGDGDKKALFTVIIYALLFAQ